MSSIFNKLHMQDSQDPSSTGPLRYSRSASIPATSHQAEQTNLHPQTQTTSKKRASVGTVFSVSAASQGNSEASTTGAEKSEKLKSTPIGSKANVYPTSSNFIDIPSPKESGCSNDQTSGIVACAPGGSSKYTSYGCQSPILAGAPTSKPADPQNCKPGCSVNYNYNPSDPAVPKIRDAPSGNLIEALKRNLKKLTSPGDPVDSPHPEESPESSQLLVSKTKRWKPTRMRRPRRCSETTPATLFRSVPPKGGNRLTDGEILRDMSAVKNHRRFSNPRNRHCVCGGRRQGTNNLSESFSCLCI